MNYYGKIEEADTLIGNMGVGVDYYKGETGAQGIPGKDGKDGKTPIKGVDYYTDEEIDAIKDEIAQKVQVGAKGEDGKSAYQIAVDEGFEGSEADWLASLKGADGRNGIDGINGTNGKDGANGIDGKTPVKGVDYFTAAEIEAIEQGAADKVDTAGYAKSADLAQVAKTGSYNDLADKPTIPSTAGLASTKYVDDKVAEIVIPTVPTKVSAFENDAGYLTEHQSLAEYAKKTEIPAPYTLPTASTSALGGVKVDGNTITITDGVISAKGGSGGAEPDAYIKDASVSGNTLTLTKKDDTEVVFTPSGGSSDIKSYSFSAGSLTAEEIANLQYCVDNPTKVIFTIDDIRIQNMYNSGKNLYFFGISYQAGIVQGFSYSIAATSVAITGTRLSPIYLGDIIITQSVIQNYLSSWKVADSLEDSNLYNARELAILLENSDGKCFSSYYNLSCSFNSAYDQGGLGMYANKNFYLQTTESGYQLWYYDGNQIQINLRNNYRIFYKT